MLDSSDLTERQQRELDYYKEYAEQYFANEEFDFAIVEGKERRPWNPYWFTYRYILDRAQGEEPRMLDFGCGAGEMSILLASQGFEACGFDISESNVALAEKNAAHHKVAERTTFVASVAEVLPYPDEHFDVVAGLDILHHVDIPLAMQECYRVLKPGGFAIFREPVEALLLDRIRNWRLTQVFFPQSKSLERHVTEDERKLNKTDHRILEGIFDRVEPVPFSVFARFHKFLPGSGEGPQRFLEKIDAAAVKILPPLRHFAGCIVYVLHKKK